MLKQYFPDGIGDAMFTSISNAPEIALPGVSRSAMQPLRDGGAFQPRRMLPPGCGHRSIDGATAHFTNRVATLPGHLRRV